MHIAGFWKVLVVTSLVLGLMGCSDDGGGDDGGAEQDVADAGEVNNQGDEPDVDEPLEDVAPQEDVVEEEEDAAAQEDAETPDAAPDMGEDEVDEPNCDQDNDGALSEACGGNDCDDTSAVFNPLLPERCDAFDNNCNGELNEGITCSFYAHTGDALYSVDPFRGESELVAGDLPNLFDIDTHPDGTLYGITGTSLYRFDEALSRWFLIGDFPQIEEGTGLAIDSFGVAWVTAGTQVYNVDLFNAETTLIGELGGDFFSSGDCVVNKEDTLYMTSKAFDQPDTLVLVDKNTGRGQAIGQIRPFTNVFGLTAGWGSLFGVNSRGELISIDPSTGQAELLHTFEGQRWFGAASNPDR